MVTENVDEESYLPKRVKLISLGDSGAGKSAIIKRHCEHRFVSRYVMTIGIDYGVIKIAPSVHHQSDDTVSVSIFDVGGHAAFAVVRSEFYEESEVALLVYDIRIPDPVGVLERWMREFKTGGGSTENCLVIVAANKRDLAPNIDCTDAKIWAQTRGYKFIESSAATSEGIQEIFELVCSAAHEDKRGPAEMDFTNDQVEAVKTIRAAKDNFQRLGLNPGATRDQINRQYKKMAILLHPDKSVAPGAEEAFKLLTIARSALLKYAK